MGEFRMPSLGADMDAGTVSEWLVKAGDEVHRGDIVAVVETEKSTIEIEIFENGVVEEILVQPGERVPVGTALALVRASAPAVAPVVPKAKPTPTRTSEPTPPAKVPSLVEERRVEVPIAVVAVPAAPPAHEGPAGPRVVSPLVRHLAEQSGIELATLEGTGPGGTVTRADVEHASRLTKRAPEARVRSSPLARRLAFEIGVDLSRLTGTGPGGAVTESDVRLAVSAAAGEAVSFPFVEGQPPSVATPEEAAMPALVKEHAETTATRPEGSASAGAAAQRQLAMRKAIGALMARSKREIPHYYLSTTIDLGSALDWLEQANLERPITQRLVVPALLLKATALAVKRVPEMNGFWVEEAFVASEAVHVGVAVSLRSGGVIAPAIHDTDKLTLDSLMDALKDLVGRARKGVLRSSEMSDPTMTVTNLGDLGVEAVYGVIYPPQVALVGFGRISQRPIASEGMLGVRPCVTATLSADHRASDGHRGGLFLAEIDRLLQEPEKL
jgi:pyruvate dehydrogenase E2 component (dihydrolipoamide acetyltransferase)